MILRPRWWVAAARSPEATFTPTSLRSACASQETTLVLVKPEGIEAGVVGKCVNVIGSVEATDNIDCAVVGHCAEDIGSDHADFAARRGTADSYRESASQRLRFSRGWVRREDGEGDGADDGHPSETEPMMVTI